MPIKLSCSRPAALTSVAIPVISLFPIRTIDTPEASALSGTNTSGLSHAGSAAVTIADPFEVLAGVTPIRAPMRSSVILTATELETIRLLAVPLLFVFPVIWVFPEMFTTVPVPDIRTPP